jgi:hypothetical protein
MSNRIRTTSLQLHRLSPAAAEVWSVVELEEVTPTTELRGKLVGPRCPGVSTIEVAYPFRPLPPSTTPSSNTLTVQAIVPEPNLWTETTPFVYEGTIELWQEGQRQDTARVSVGLKMSDLSDKTPLAPGE